MGERASLRYKKLEDQKMIRTLLQDQIEKKQKSQKDEIKAKHDFENMLNEQNDKNLEMMRIRRAEMKNKAKNHWQAELERAR